MSQSKIEVKIKSLRVRKAKSAGSRLAGHLGESGDVGVHDDRGHHDDKMLWGRSREMIHWMCWYYEPLFSTEESYTGICWRARTLQSAHNLRCIASGMHGPLDI